MNGIQKTIISCDPVLDHVPIVSTITNLVHLVERAVLGILSSTTTVANNEYYSYIESKNIGRMLAALLPVIGNIYLMVMDYLYPTPDIEFILAKIAEDKKYIECVSDTLKNDATFMLKVAEIDPSLVGNASPKLCDDKSFALAALEAGAKGSFISDRLTKDKEFIAGWFRISEKEIIAGPFGNRVIDRDIRMDESLKADADFMLSLIKVNHRAAHSVSKELWGDRAFALEAIKLGAGLWFLEEQFRDDKDFMLEVIEVVKCSSIHASKRLRADKDFMLEVVRLDKGPMFPSDTLLQDTDVMLEAVKQGKPLECVSDTLLDDPAFMLEVIKQHSPTGFKHASKRLKKDRAFVKEAIMRGVSVRDVSARLRGNADFMLSVIEEKPGAFMYASERLKNNRKFVRKALELGVDSSHIGKGLMIDPEFMDSLV